MNDTLDMLTTKLGYQEDLLDVIFDVETTARDGDPSPHIASNRMMCIVARCPELNKVFYQNRSGGTMVPKFGHFLESLVVMSNKKIRLVAHNIKFDLGYLMQGNQFEQAFRNHVHGVWDTMIADYIYSGQQNKFSSLNALAERHGFAGKLSNVEFDKDGALNVDPKELRRYCEQDVVVTSKVYTYQAANFREQRHLVAAHSWVAVAYAEMERTGLRLDMDRVRGYQKVSEAQAQALAGDMAAVTMAALDPHNEHKINVTANRTISTLLHGRPGIKVIDKVNDGKYMNGNQKYKRVARVLVPTVPLAGAYAQTGDKGYNPTLGYPVNEKALRELEGKGIAPLQKYLETLATWRKVTKLLGTYWEGLPAKCPNSEPLLHPSIHQVTTNTARSASSNPNGQNIPEVVRATIIPDDGYEFIDVDYKQLEVCGLALLSGDRQLNKDLDEGLDVHVETGKMVYPNKVMTKDERRDVKMCNFLTIYGGSPSTMAASLGIQKELAQRIQKSFYGRYPGVQRWQKRMIYDAERNGWIPPEAVPIDGQLPRRYAFTEKHGRRLVWNEKKNPTWMQKRGGSGLGFQPTELKNYRVQCIATGDIAPIFVALAYLLLIELRNSHSSDNQRNPDIKLTMVVHDSLLSQVRVGDKQLAERWFAGLQGLAGKGVKMAFKKLWNYDLTIPLRLDGERKMSWGQKNPRVLGN